MDEAKNARWNFKVTEHTDEALRSKAKQSGKTLTRTLEDLLNGERLFNREIEQFITAESDRLNCSRWEIIEMALVAAARSDRAAMKAALLASSPTALPTGEVSRPSPRVRRAKGGRR